MEDVFKNLEKAGKNDVDNLVKWMKDSKVIGEDEVAKTGASFKGVKDQKQVTLEEFKGIVAQVAAEKKKSYVEVDKMLGMAAPLSLEDMFANLQKAGKNDADSLVNWMKGSKVIAEDEAAKTVAYFNVVKDQKQVSLEEFKGIVAKVAAEKKKSYKEVEDMLVSYDVTAGPGGLGDMFRNLQKSGKTDVNSLVKWMKDSKVINDDEVGKTLAYFKNVKDQKNVSLDQFKGVVGQIATDKKKTFEEMGTRLVGANAMAGMGTALALGTALYGQFGSNRAAAPAAAAPSAAAGAVAGSAAAGGALSATAVDGAGRSTPAAEDVLEPATENEPEPMLEAESEAEAEPEAEDEPEAEEEPEPEAEQSEPEPEASNQEEEEEQSKKSSSSG